MVSYNPAARAAYTGGEVVTAKLASRMRALVSRDGVTPEYRAKVEDALDRTFDKACVRDFPAMVLALWAPATAVDYAKAEALRLAENLGLERKNLAALQTRRADNAAARGSATALLPQKQEARKSIEPDYAAAQTALEASKRQVQSLTDIDDSARKNVRSAKEKLQALDQREEKIDARLQVLKQAAENCQAPETTDPETSDEAGNSENKNENAPDKDILEEIKKLMQELDALPAARAAAVTERSIAEQALSAASDNLAAGQKRLAADRAAFDDVAARLVEIKKRIADLEAEIAQRNAREKELDAQITESLNLIAALEVKLAEAKRVADTISDKALAEYKAALKPFDNWGCASGMAMVEGTFCMDIYEYPNRKGDRPAVGVSWTDAEKACRAVGKRLCTDAEWAFACAGPDCFMRHTPGDYSSETCNLGLGFYGEAGPRISGWRPDMQEPGPYDDTVNPELAPGAAFFACDSPYGPADLVGNLWEWIADTHKRPNVHGVRIGGNPSQFEPNCGDASWYDASTTLPHLGFRCCADPRNMLTQTALK